MPRKKRTKAKIIKYQLPKAAGGGSGDGEGPGGGYTYKPGQNIVCKIVSKEPSGYLVIDIKNGNPGYMPSDRTHEPGKEITALFVCFDKKRLLLSERYTAGKQSQSC